ncbi:hypothetical protein KAW18_18650 [candidate division WOR-3 bacterium]|nr:hypothetical protein [candidate division WOR-3 bacterium]
MVSAEEIGRLQAETIVGYVNLFYNNTTAERYYRTLITLLEDECKRRGIEINDNTKV